MLHENREKVYTSDITDAEWIIIEAILRSFFARQDPRGRPPKLDLREIYNAIMYVLRNGCTWRNLPEGFPKWQSVYYYFRVWCKSGLWKKINKKLRRQLRKQANRQDSPSLALVDAQSVKGTVHEGNGYDGGKKVNGRKRHILVDTMGFILVVLITPANISDKAGLKQMLTLIRGQYGRLEKILADQGYSGETFRKIIDEMYQLIVEIAPKPEGKGFKVIPKRWVVERTFAWLGNYRRLSKDYEVLVGTSEALIYMAMSSLMLKRLASKTEVSYA